ncbi:MAG: efflux RND transporter periplasmic adaptor subunit [Burkholderiales bacterium]|nr:MAG: efflux RND transporter periplasmic adaptor subunit [Burkholderiales bacterium]
MKPHILCPTALAVIIAPLATPLSAQPLDCMIQPHQIVQVGTAVPGVIEQLTVERGDFVTRGQVVAQLNAGVERAQLTVARERAAQVGEVQAAVGSRELADRELVRAKDLHGQEFVSGAYLDKARAEAEVASGRTAQAEERRRQASREVELAAAQLAQRTIRSPIDGVVVERYLSPGEYVDQKPVVRIASIDPLRVDVLVPAAAFGRVQVGDRGVVVPELFNQLKHEATVSVVDRVIDAASNTFRVRLELPNPGRQLPAGLRCKVDLGASLLASANSAPAPSADAARASRPRAVTADAAAPTTLPPAMAVPAAATTRVSVDPSPKRGNSAGFDPQTAAMHALENWRKAWMLKDLDGYFSAYVPDFRGESKSTEGWRRWREERIRAASDLDLRLSDAQFDVLGPDRVKVDFRQEFRAAHLHADNRKTIVFVFDDGRWLIEEERVQR